MSHSPWRMSRATRVREHSRRNAPVVREHERIIAPPTDPRDMHLRETNDGRVGHQLNSYATTWMKGFREALADGMDPDTARDSADADVEEEFMADESHGLQVRVNTREVREHAEQLYDNEVQRLEMRAMQDFEVEVAMSSREHDGELGKYVTRTAHDGAAHLYLIQHDGNEVWLGRYDDGNLAWKSAVNHDWTSLRSKEGIAARLAQAKRMLHEGNIDDKAGLNSTVMADSELLRGDYDMTRDMAGEYSAARKREIRRLRNDAAVARLNQNPSFAAQLEAEADEFERQERGE